MSHQLDTSLFEEQYRMLNPEQKLAVDTVDGPVMVMAGPGTGKTQILSLRIANIVRVTDTSPDAILALTFTESAASNMRKRLVRMMGSSAYQVHIHTFHGLASTLIGKYPEYFPRILGSKLATDVDKLRIAEEILRNHTGKHIRWYDNFTDYASGLLSAIDELKREYVSPEQLSRHVSDEQYDFDRIPDLYHETTQHKGKMKAPYQELQKRIEKNQELVSLYIGFLAKMEEQRLYDFTDMLTEVVHACENNPEFLLQLQEEYQYILVDEHQDSNNLQNRMIELLGNFHESPNIFVVGDDKQAVYRFQGASPDYFYGFQQKYPEAIVIHLVNNYRSTQSVLNIAHSLLHSDIELQAQAGHANVITDKSLYTTDGAELFGITQSIRKLLETGIEPAEVAILTRTNSDSGRIARALDNARIPYIVESDIDITDSPFIRALFSLFHAIYNPHDDREVSHTLYAPWSSCNIVDSARLIHAGDKKRVRSLVDIMLDKSLLSSAHVEEPKEFHKFAQAITRFHQQSYTEHATDVFTAIFKEFNIIESIDSSHLQVTLGLLQVLYDDVQGFVGSNPRGTFHEYIEYIRTLDEHGKKLKLKVAGGRSGFVRIMTAHKSKGLEFDHVFVPFMVDKKWGNMRGRDLIKILDRVFDGVPDNQNNDDERRLLYVAFTRARRQLHLSLSERREDGGELVPSVFWSDISSEHIVEVDTADVCQEYESQKLSALIAGTPTAVSDRRNEFHEYLMSLLDTRPLAATHLNNYLADPWEYIFKNLIRVPELQATPMMYGTSVHYALETMYKLVSVGGTPTVSGLIEAFGAKLFNQPMSDADYNRLLAQGERTLTVWFGEHEKLFYERGYSELGVGIVMGATDIHLSGKMDRFEFINGSDVHVRIIDFKTGKPHTRNDILGKTKSSDGNYYRQLQFYKLLMRYYNEGAYMVDDLILHFVEPKDTGKFVVEHFDIPESEVDELEVVIESMMTSLRNGEYWEHNPDPKKCNFASMVTKLRGF